MTVEEKLEKAIDFIKSIESLDVPITTRDDIIDESDVYCDECGVSTSIKTYNGSDRFVEAKYVDELKDKAWHLLVDFTD